MVTETNIDKLWQISRFGALGCLWKSKSITHLEWSMLMLFSFTNWLNLGGPANYYCFSFRAMIIGVCDDLLQGTTNRERGACAMWVVFLALFYARLCFLSGTLGFYSFSVSGHMLRNSWKGPHYTMPCHQSIFYQYNPQLFHS